MRLMTALLTASLPLLANGQAQLLPAGEFVARDGRPGNGLKYRVSDARGQELAAAMNATIKATPIVIDYEHQTLHKERNGQPAPAAGWIHSVSWLSGKGLVADVQWTDKASAAIKAGEYLYLSPVITWDGDTGDVTGVHLAALTNHPGLLGMDAVAALSALNPGADGAPQETPPMKLLLAALSTFLGLQAALTEEQAAIDALKAYKPKPMLPDALTTALGLQAGADETSALTAVNKLKAPTEASVQLITQLQTQLTEQGNQLSALTTQLAGDKVARDVDGAIAEGKLPAAQRDVYIKAGQTSYELLTTMLGALQPIPGLAGQNAAAKAGAAGSDKHNVSALTAEQTQVAKQLGISAEAYLKNIQAAAA